MPRTFRDFVISLLLFLIKLLEDTVHPNKGVNQEIGRYAIQETGNVTQERGEGNSQVKGDSKVTAVHQREGSQSCLEQTRESEERLFYPFSVTEYLMCLNILRDLGSWWSVWSYTSEKCTENCKKKKKKEKVTPGNTEFSQKEKKVWLIIK